MSANISPSGLCPVWNVGYSEDGGGAEGLAIGYTPLGNWNPSAANSSTSMSKGAVTLNILNLM